MSVTSVHGGGTCAYCGQWHTGLCSRIKSIEYHPNGQISRVELRGPNDVLRDPQGWPLTPPKPAAGEDTE